MNQVAVRTGLFRDGWRYMAYWLLFGAVAGLVGRPVATEDGEYWAVKLYDHIPQGLVFGILCGVVYILVQNLFNKGRDKGRNRWNVFFVWMGVKVAIFGLYTLLGM